MIKYYSKSEAFIYSEKLYSDFCNDGIGNIPTLARYCSYFVVGIHLHGKENVSSLIKEIKSQYPKVRIIKSYLKTWREYAINFYFDFDV